MENIPYSKIVADSITTMLAYWDKDRICRFANQAYLDLVGKRSEDVVDRMTMEEFLGPLYETTKWHIENAYHGFLQEFEREIIMPDGELRHSLTTYKPDVFKGEVRGIIIHDTDVTDLKVMEIHLKAAKEKAEALATHDSLTGLPNRILLNEKFKNTLAFAKRKATKFAVGVMDVDDFKKINDRYGHLSGDRVLQETAKRALESLRNYDVISRFGGDEFILLLVEMADTAQVSFLMDRYLEALRQPIQVRDYLVHPTFSLGISLYPEDGLSMEELVRKADKALYRAKEEGKDRYVIYKA